MQEVSHEVLYRGDGEFIIKVDCPDGVIGCDEDNTEFVINDNGQWIIVDENPSIARDISPGNPNYPTGEVGSDDRVIAVARSTLHGLYFLFVEVSQGPLLVPYNNDVDTTPEDDLIAISKPLDGNVTV